MSERAEPEVGPDLRRIVIATLCVLLAIAGLAAVTALVLEHGGFRITPHERQLLRLAESVIIGLFVLDRLVRLSMAGARRRFLRDNGIDFGLIILAAIAILASLGADGGQPGHPGLRNNVLTAGTLYVAITQIYMLVAAILRGVRLDAQAGRRGFHWGWLLVGGFLLLCLAGSGLLMLPAASPDNPSRPLFYEDALFVAVSATCDTGLPLRNIGLEFTRLGQLVILVLIQVGGLGIMAAGTVAGMSLARSLSRRDAAADGPLAGLDRSGDIRRTALFVVLATFFCEAVGAILLFPMFASAPDAAGDAPTALHAAWSSIFHSVSAFCNAGFSLYRGNLMEGAHDWGTPMREHWQVLGVIGPLIILGGLGFPVLEDCAGYVRQRLVQLWTWLGHPNSQPRPATARAGRSLHSRLALTTSGVLIVLGTIGLLLVEPTSSATARKKGAFGARIIGAAQRQETDWVSMTPAQRFREAAFQSITARTAGFNTIDTGKLSNASKMVLCGLMIIGGSPAGAAGGMKTVTLAVLMLTAYCAFRRRDEAEASKRGFSAQLVRKAVALGILYLALVGAVTLLMCVDKPDWAFIDVLFESCSACGNVGLSSGLISDLDMYGKTVLSAGMFIGRLGPIMLGLAITSRLRRGECDCPPENVIIG